MITARKEENSGVVIMFSTALATNKAGSDQTTTSF